MKPMKLSGVLGTLLLLLPASTGLWACSGVETPPPEPAGIEIVFPTAFSAVASGTVTVRGTARGMAAVRVNGTLATTSNDFADWQAEVALEPGGPNVVQIETEDTSGVVNPEAGSLVVYASEKLLVRPSAIALDAAGGVALVMDDASASLVSMDLATGVRRVLHHEARKPGAEHQGFMDVALDPAGDRAFVLDFGLQSVIEIGLPGARRVIADASTGSGPVLMQPVSMVLDAAGNRLLVLDGTLGALVAIDLASGARAVLADASTGAGPALGAGNDMALDVAGNRVLIADPWLENPGLVAVDLATGDRAVVSSATAGAGPELFHPQAVVVDAAGNRALLHDVGGGALLAVDLATGDRTVIADDATGEGPALGATSGMALDAAGNRVLMADRAWNGLLAINLTTGDREIVGGVTVGTGPALEGATDLAFDMARSRIVVFEEPLAALLTMDLATSERQRMLLPTDEISYPVQDGRGMAFDVDGNQALVIDRGTEPIPFAPGAPAAGVAPGVDGDRPALLAVDGSTGECRFVATVSSGAERLAMDPSGERVLVLDVLSSGITAIDLASGQSDVIWTGAGSASEATDLAVDASRGLAVVAGRLEPSLLGVDLGSGDVRVIADASTGQGVDLVEPERVVVDQVRGRALVVDRGLGALVSVDLDTGDRSIVLDAGSAPGAALEPSLSDIAVDAERQRAVIFDVNARALYLVDLDTGARAIIAM
jgi:DNA-binding beta-propeller fold protein YncE